MIKHLSFLVPLTLSSLALADTVLLKNGETLHGNLTETHASYLLLQLPETEGEAIRRISPDQITTLTFSDPNNSLEQQALKRALFLPFLSETDAKVLPAYLQHLISIEQPLAALSYAKLWHPKNKYISLDPLYRTILVQSSLAADLPTEALVHAQNWLELSPQPVAHPLPWQIQAQHELDTGQVQKGLWTALTPIAHAYENDQPSLAPLHQIAAQAYEQLGYTEHSSTHRSQTNLPVPTIPLHLDPR